MLYQVAHTITVSLEKFKQIIQKQTGDAVHNTTLKPVQYES